MPLVVGFDKTPPFFLFLPFFSLPEIICPVYLYVIDEKKKMSKYNNLICMTEFVMVEMGTVSALEHW